MTVEVRPFDSLGRFEIDWLNARHHFSFGQYHDPERMGVGPLARLERRSRGAAAPASIRTRTATWRSSPMSGEVPITHRDNLGNEGRTEAGDVQVMSAGTGIVHAEHNLDDEPLELFQIWIQPRTRGLAPRWAQTRVPVRRAGRRARDARLGPRRR